MSSLHLVGLPIFMLLAFILHGQHTILTFQTDFQETSDFDVMKSHNCMEERFDQCKEWSLRRHDDTWTTDYDKFHITGYYFFIFLLNIDKLILILSCCKADVHQCFWYFIFIRNTSGDIKTRNQRNTTFECYQNDGTR